MKIQIRRSDEWVQAQQLASGANVLECQWVDIDPAQLSTEARAVLLQEGKGRYRESYEAVHDLRYEYTFARFLVDAKPHDLTENEINELILATAVRAKAAGDEREAKEASEREAKEAEALKEAKRAAKIAEAREILGDVIEKLECRVAEVTEDMETLATFIRAIPPDAKRGALRKLADADTDDAMETIRKKTEYAASVSFHILDDLDEDESDN